MPDYQQMYLTMMRATEKALNTLIEAQQKCEELYLAGEGTRIDLLPVEPESEAEDGIRIATPVTSVTGSQ